MGVTQVDPNWPQEVQAEFGRLKPGIDRFVEQFTELGRTNPRFQQMATMYQAGKAQGFSSQDMGNMAGTLAPDDNPFGDPEKLMRRVGMVAQLDDAGQEAYMAAHGLTPESVDGQVFRGVLAKAKEFDGMYTDAVEQATGVRIPGMFYMALFEGQAASFNKQFLTSVMKQNEKKGVQWPEEQGQTFGQWARGLFSGGGEGGNAIPESLPPMPLGAGGPVATSQPAPTTQPAPAGNPAAQSLNSVLGAGAKLLAAPFAGAGPQQGPQEPPPFISNRDRWQQMMVEEGLLNPDGTDTPHTEAEFNKRMLAYGKGTEASKAFYEKYKHIFNYK